MPEVWLELKGAESRQLQRGDLALVPHGEGHRMTSQPGIFAARLFDWPRELVSERYEILRHSRGGASTNMVCGAVRFHRPAAYHLVKILPKMICIEVSSSPHMDLINTRILERQKMLLTGQVLFRRLSVDFALVLPFKDSSEAAEPRCSTPIAIKPPDTPRRSEAPPR